MKAKRAKARPSIGFGVFDFCSVALAAASGQLRMDIFVRYLVAMRPRKPRTLVLEVRRAK